VPALIATAGATDANSFVTEETFIAYLATRKNAPAGSTVSGSTLTEVEQLACIEATRDLDVLAWKGKRASATQRLSLPRTQWMQPDPAPGAPPHFADDAIPRLVQDATCELAVEYLKAGTTDLAALPATDGVIRKKVDVLETEYAQPHARAQGLARFPRVLAMLAGLYDGATGTLVRE
jgi:hypothetical protein